MIHTIKSYDEKEFDTLVNDFEKTHKVFATQTHYDRKENFKDVFVAVLFYKE